MANTSKSTKKTAKKRAGTTSSGTRNAGAGGTRSRTKASTRNASPEDDINYTRNTGSQRRTGQENDSMYEEDYANARYRGLSNEGEEGDLGSNRRKTRSYSDDRDYRDERDYSDSYSGDRDSGRNRARSSQSGWENSYDDDQMPGRNRGMTGSRWSGRSGGRSEYEDEQRGNGHRQQRNWQESQGRPYMHRDSGYDQEMDYNRNWSSDRSQGMAGYDEDRGRSRLRSQYENEWTGGDRGREMSGYGERRYGSSQRPDYGRESSEYSGRSDRDWRQGSREWSDIDAERRYRSGQRNQHDDWSSYRNQDRDRYDEDRRFSSNRGDMGSDWRSRQNMDDYDSDWRSGNPRSGRSQRRDSWDDDRDQRYRR